MSPEQRLASLLAMHGENELVEFKEAKNQYAFDKLGKYFSALSNEANLCGQSRAWLVLGVKDDRTVVGTQFRTKTADLMSLKKEIADKVTHRLTFIAIHEVAHPQGRVLLFEIPAAPQGLPIAWDGHYFGRDGESLGALNIEEIERIRLQNRADDWSAVTLPEASLEDLDPEAIEQARKSFARKNPRLIAELEAWDTPTFLNKAKLTINGKITRTAILLLGLPEAAHWLNPSSATISWILKDRDGLERDYQHFSCPLLLSVDEVFHKIRNLKYRYLVEGTLFPEEVEQYDPYIIREALNNAIAHQDYTLGGKISLVEFEDDRLCFSNEGGFIPGSIESVIHADAPETRYRNRFLADAMVNLNMIDTIGSGIRKMFQIQRNRFFPLPEYRLNERRVQVTIIGRVLDQAYARKLAACPELSLDDIMLLDRVQKQQPITDQQARHLKKRGLIEGRKPNYYISAELAEQSGDKAEYIRYRAFDDQHYKQMIIECLEKFKTARRSDIDRLLLDKLPDVLDANQKHHKVKNLMQSLKNQGLIENDGRIWRLSNP
ncbi:MAG: putative DNA binding domain-containing protein [Marinospirillum sp.]|uniref:RNA-binding domain-containing protein n=1 Tax=Marinospirillum sp. TaxID=2183934 RepID=UPI0019ED8D82|nr:RNA-binding domain-containing protein [Marinospirillum sp.]MBE0506409.1 putative DNA binding domain-containing protein [Marinospirillum sp.]